MSVKPQTTAPTLPPAGGARGEQAVATRVGGAAVAKGAEVQVHGDDVWRRPWFGRVFARMVGWSSWALLVAVVAQWVLIRWLGDVWWPSTVMIFAPRWPFTIPLAAVAVVCLACRRQHLPVVAASAAMLAGPVMGLNLPLSFGSSVFDGYHLKVMSVNRGGGGNWALVRRDVENELPDVVAFQEFGVSAPKEPLGPGWHWKTGYGTAIASRYPIVEADELGANGVDRWGTIAVRVRLRLPVGDLRVCCLHLNTPRHGLDALEFTRRGIFGIDDLERNTESRSNQSQTVRRWLGDSNLPTIVAGDFNMPVESQIYRRDWGAFRNVFSTAGWGYGHTKFTRWHGVRIDHILTDQHWRVSSCHVAEPTGGDHRPVVAELVLNNP